MFVDSRTLPSEERLQADVCIIGAGAAGITLARELAGQPVRVIVLESGGLTADHNTQVLFQGRNTGLPYYPLTVCRLRYFGGATNHWEGECRPLDEIDFEARDGIPLSGWPFPKSHLAPFYQRAESICQVDSGSWDPTTLATGEAPQIPAADSPLRTCILQLSPPTRFGTVYREQLKRAQMVGAARSGKAPDRFLSHVWNVLTDLGGAMGAVRRRLGGPPPKLLTLERVSEHVPNPESRVTLSNERDALGRRRVNLTWRLSEVDRRSIKRTQELIARALGQAGLGRVKNILDEHADAWPVRGQSHHMGTTRMHEDPTQGVVDPDGLVHGMSNLFVAGSSVFPTSGSGPPTLTIVALALRLADHIKRLLS